VVARLAPYPALIAFTAALAALVAGVNSVFGLSLPTSVASDCVTLMLELGAVAGGLAMLGAARHTHGEGFEGREQMRLPWVLAALAAWLTIICALVAVLFGYLALASFLARQMIWIGLILALLFVSIAFTDELFPAILAPERTIGRFARIGIGLSPSALEPISVLLSGLSRLVLLLLAWMAILQPFGAASDLYGSLTSSALNFKLGQVTVSPGVVLGAIAVFVVGLAITRAIRHWVESRYLPKTNMDIGARTSLTLAISYLGGLTAVVVACAYLGLSLERITLLASALSVGIGFGLQAIISNFISGLILLAERPIKVGDWIAVGDQEGDVKRVNVRATEIELFDRSKLIIPNSDLISKPVRNITHPGALGRVALVFQIDAGADPAAVHDVLGECFSAHSDVLPDPKPGVYMTNVKDGALDFLAIAFVATPRDVFRVKSELLYAMIPALKARGIAFASSSPTVVVNAAPVGGGPVRAEGEAGSA
jgi:small-conductance mechanosensitive channel